MLNKVKIIKNYTLSCIDGEIGKVKDLYFEDHTWIIKYLIVDTGNWLTSRQVLISPLAITTMNKDEGYISVNLTKDQIENSPILESDKPVSLQFQREFHGYFQYPMYPVYPMSGMGMGYTGVGIAIPYTPIETEKEKFIKVVEEENDWDPHLRSTRIVSGYGIQAIDDKIGHVEDFIIDAETWEIVYMEIDTKNWLPGRKILISPNWIDHVSWNESKVFVNLRTSEIEQSPEYTAESILDRDFETRLYKHYNRNAYWIENPEAKEKSTK